MSYHNTSTPVAKSTTNAQGQTAPTGYHYMPDGSLMLDSSHVGYQEDKVITSFDLDLSDLPASSSVRSFTFIGDSGAEFILEIKNEDNHYYNFVTSSFQAAKANLENAIGGGNYKGAITFPTVTDDDQYDISVYAKPGTKHSPYNEVRFGDGSLDINSSTGSNSLMMQKVVYQYTALTLTINGFSPTSTVSATLTPDTIATSRGRSLSKTAFSFVASAAGTAAYRVLRQPISSDIVSFLQPVVGAAPIDLPGENIYPTATAAFEGDDINGAITSGAIVEIDADVAGNVVIGDKITTPVTTDTVNGARDASAVAVTMDAAVATKMAVGDQVTGNAALDAGIFTVASLDSTNVFSISSAVAIADGVTLTFSSKINRSLTTVLNLNPPAQAKQFTMSQDIQFRDNAPLTFFNQKNFSWPINNFAHLLQDGMILIPITNLTEGTTVGSYRDSITIFPGTKNEKTITKNKKPALSTLAKKPTIVKGLVTVQEGQIVFDKQQVLALAGDTLKVGGYGVSEVLRLYGWEIRLTDLAVTLTAPTTTTTEATAAHATIAVADKEGVINNFSRVGGIGINPALQNPLITSGGGADGAGDWVMDAVQTLESGVTLTVENTGRVATITGNIEIIKAGTASQTIRFDIEKILSTSAPS
jgi:hypothetical protein